MIGSEAQAATGPGAPARVLITGAGGFIGRHLVTHQLERGRQVVALDTDLSALDEVRHESLHRSASDVADASAVRGALVGVDTVFHLAAAHLSVSAGADEFRRVNVDAVRSLVEACEEAGVSRLVYCSTVGVYGAIKSPPADEATLCAPEFDYERTKLEAERVFLAAAEERGFPVVVLRPAWVYGAGCPRTEKLFRAIGKGRFLVAGPGRAMRHSVYIRDAVRALDLAATADALGEVAIIADSRAVTVRELVDEVARIQGAPRPPSVPTWLLFAAGAAAEVVFGMVGREPPLSRRTLRFFSGNTSFVTARAEQLLGFAAEYSIEDGLAETHRILGEGAFWELPLPPRAEAS